MSVETNLRTAMAEAVAPTHPDTERLVSASRRRGLGIRRRRQALGSVGVAAALGLAVLAPNVVAGDHGSRQAQVAGSVAVGTAPESFDADKTSAITGRSTAAALLYAVGLEAAGTADHVRGQGGGNGPDTYAVFRFTPTGSPTYGEVGVNVQHYGGDAPKRADQQGDKLGQCDSFMEHCVPTTLPDGSRMLTYDDRSDYQGRRGVRRVVDLLRQDGVRVVAYATNGFDITERDEQISGDEPVLTSDQLVAIVNQSWWGPELPTYFATQGEALTYDEIGGSIEATKPPSAKS
ncbi:MAG: hypothetical protein JF565_03385 [Propionibacteriales bacterium]|jgi:hypothetical protein|nr:hypothetical protein [Propionibacteriales bacterium]